MPTERSGLQAAETATAKSLTGKAFLSNEKKTIMAQIGDILEKEQKRETERADAQPTDAEQSAQQQTTPPHLLATARELFHRLPIII